MRFSEILNLVRLNLIQNKFKVLLTSIGIIVGAATIVSVIAIGRGGKADVADQFRNLNAGALDISYEQSQKSSGFSFGGETDRKNSENITLTADDMDDITASVPGLSDSTITYTTKQNIYGGNIEDAESCTIAGTLSNYAELSNLSMLFGDYLTDSDNENKSKICVLGYTAAKNIFGSAEAAYDSIVYIDDRPYTVGGVLAEQGSVKAGISADEAIFIPYATGINKAEGFSRPENGEMPSGFDSEKFSGGMPEGFSRPENGVMPSGFDSEKFSGEMPEGFSGSGSGNKPDLVSNNSSYTLTGEKEEVRIPVGTDVTTLNGVKTDFEVLEKGSVIKCSLEKDSDGNNVITEVWIVE